MSIPKIKNAYKNIKSACEQRLQELYPLGVPAFVQERYQKELDFLQHSNYIDDFEILRCLYKEARKCSQFISLRGTSTSSYIIYLLSNSILNPLPAHYYCPKCGYFEVVPTRLFGMDLPNCECPDCKSELIADGFNLPPENEWGIDGKREICFFCYSISEEFFPFAKNLLKKLYPDNVIVPLGICHRTAKEIIGIRHSGYLILPLEQKIEDYPELIAYLDNGERCFSINFFDIPNYNFRRVELRPTSFVRNIVTLQRKTGIYANEITLKELKALHWNDLINTTALNIAETYLFRTYKPKTFYDMVSLDSASRSLYTNMSGSPEQSNNYYSLPDILDQPEFVKYPCYNKEDFFHTLLDLGFEYKKAYEIVEFIRRGRQNSSSAEYQNEFDSFDIPDELKTVAKQYKNIYSRSNNTEFFLIFAKLAYYEKKNSRIFGEVISKSPNR